MRIDVLFSDRVGIAQEILAAVARRSLNVTAGEVEPPHTYMEARRWMGGLLDLRSQLKQIEGLR